MKMGKFSDDPKENLEKAKKLVNEFIEQELDKKIENLENFSFWNIKDKHEFGNGYASPDADRTKIAYAIDYILYTDKTNALPDFKLYGYTTQPANYSGETINTFNTLFSTNKQTRERIEKIWNEKFGDGDFKNKVYNVDDKNADDFYHVYQRIGNLTLLPCLTVCGGSINTWKGLNSEIKDYMFPFMQQLEKAYKNTNSPIDEKDAIYELSLLMKKNEFFFGKGNIDSFDKFKNIFMLDDWEELKLCEYLRSSELNENNIDVAKKYVENASRFIKNRTKRIVDVLKEKFN